MDTKTEFSYQGKTAKGEKKTGLIQANSIGEARVLLRKEGLLQVKVGKKSNFSLARLNPFKSKKIKAKEITIFIRQLATMIAVGIPLIQALTIVSDGNDNVKVKNLITGIKQDIEGGLPLSQALAKHPEYFDELFCSLIAASEASGTLDTMLERIATYREKTETLKSKIKKALMYPIVIIFISLIVTVILLIYVIPTFEDLFAGFGAELPLFTRIVINASKTTQTYGIYLLIGIIALGFAFNYLRKNNLSFKNYLQKLLLRLPIFGNLIEKNILARFTRTLATTFAAGVPLPNALEFVAKTANNITYYRAIMQVHDLVISGQKMHIAMTNTGKFPNLLIQMIGIGEESGTLEVMLNKIANIYEEEIDTTVEGLSTLIEPMIMVILGILIGGLVIAMYLPIFKMGAII